MLNLLNKNNYDKIGFDLKIMKKNSSKKIGIIFLIKSKYKRAKNDANSKYFLFIILKKLKKYSKK